MHPKAVTDLKNDLYYPLDKKDILKQEVGQLLWAYSQSWHNYCDVTNIASNINQATVKQLVDINKSISKVKGYPYRLKFHPIDKDAKLVV